MTTPTFDRHHPLNQPDVEAAVRGTLVKCGVPQNELEDALQETKVRTWAALTAEGEGADHAETRIKALACGTASNWASSRMRDVIAEREREKAGKGPLETHALPAERRGEDAM